MRYISDPTLGREPMNHPPRFRGLRLPSRVCNSARVPLGLLSFAMAFLSFSLPLRGESTIEYNRDIRPILLEHCFACHGADSAAREGDLRLDRREEALEAEAIKAGNPDESEMIVRLFTDDPEQLMPPPESTKTISPEEKELLIRWIKSGAEYQPHWSLILPRKPQLPAVKNAEWVKNPIDRFVLARLEENGLAPTAEAEGSNFFRRLHLDITGLPPKPEDVSAFVADYAADQDAAVRDWTDRLLASPAWGEHRGRYWLDAARYGDTHGLHFDNYREMWPYRDWVIRAFNANQPFDQFIVEQIAGDLLENPSDDQLIATGFQRCNITTNEGGTIDEENLAVYAADRVQTFGWVFMGMTTNCGQCHDHKFDAFTMKDYYSLAAFFRNTTQLAKDGNSKDGRGPILVLPSEEDRPRWKALPDIIASAVAKRDQHKEDTRGDFHRWLASATKASLAGGRLSEGLVVHAPLDEGEGKEVRGTTATGEGTFKAVSDVHWIPEGKLGASAIMKPGGTFDLGDLGDFEKDQPFSYGGWVMAASPKSASGGIIARMHQANNFRGWDLWQDGDAFAAHLIHSWPDNAIKVKTRRGTLKPGKWQHVFVTYDGSAKPEGIKIFLNGKQQPLEVETNNLQKDATIRNDVPLRIGQRSHSQVFAGGSIQDARVYDRLLNEKEVQSLHQIASLQPLLALIGEKRTPEQQEALYAHYLQTHDPQYPTLAAAVAQFASERRAIRGRSPITHIQRERDNSPAMAHILIRGAYDKKGAAVEAATPTELHPMAEGAPRNRLGLAQWLIDPANSLTARVTVNRFWQELFGQGIVVSPEDLGIMGSLPSHPHLLDWLVIDFTENGWDVKRLFKHIFNSATYRQAAITTPQKLEKDRDNVLLSRGPRFRMDAEMVRDYALAASGLLSKTMYGPSVKPYQPTNIWDMVGLPGGDTRDYRQDEGENLFRRTVYSFWKRMAPPPNLEAFNAPSREMCIVRRDRTNTPLQALVTLNDPQFVEAARHLAEAALTQSGGNDDASIDYVTSRVLCRDLKSHEREIIMGTKNILLDYYKSHPDDAAALVAVGESDASEPLDAAQLATWTMVCNQILNLDEVFNK